MGTMATTSITAATPGQQVDIQVASDATDLFIAGVPEFNRVQLSARRELADFAPVSVDGNAVDIQNIAAKLPVKGGTTLRFKVLKPLKDGQSVHIEVV
jgi:hypothetical protein